MQSPVPGLDNREFALVAWVLIALLLGLFNGPIRHSLGQVAGTLLHWKILLIFAAMLVYVGVLVWGLASINLWTKDLLSETVYWTFVTGFVLLFRAVTAYDDDDFFKKIILAALGLTALTEFLVNLRPMTLVPELLLVPILVLLGGTLALAQSQPKYRQARGCLEAAAVLIGLALLAYVIVVTVRDPERTFTYENLLELVVPLALTVGFIPFIAVAALLATYGSLFGRLNWKLSADKSTRRYAKRRAVRVGHVRLSSAQRLSREMAWKLAPQSTRVDVDRAVEECGS